MQRMDSWPEEVWPGHKGNWGRWANDLGSLNLLGASAAMRGAAAVTSGETFALSRPLSSAEIGTRWPTPFVVHEMIKADEDGFEEGDLTQSAAEQITTRIHGMINTHIDALAHMGYRGLTFNGYRFPDVVTKEDAAKLMDIAPKVAITTRGVLFDIPRRRGVEELEPGDSVQADELDHLLDELEPGDAAVIRIGGTKMLGLGADGLSEHGTWHHGTWAGLDTDCVDVLAGRDVSVIATDSPGDTFPHRHEAYCRSPVHVLAEVFYGIPLIHSMDLDELATACAKNDQTTFSFTAAPLHITGGTGSLVTPVAVM